LTNEAATFPRRGRLTPARIIGSASSSSTARRRRPAHRGAVRCHAALADRPDLGLRGLACPEARYVKALDKLLPKITHMLNDLATIHEQGIPDEILAARYHAQRDELRGYATDFPALLGLHAELISRVLARLGPATVPAAP
jgi:hypothetical protein